MKFNLTLFSKERKARKLFPASKKHFWYCGEMNDYQYQLMKQEKPWKARELVFPCETLLLNPFVNYNQIHEGAILPMMKLNGWVAFYKITRKYRDTSSDDFLSWDDGYNIDIVLDHVEAATPVEALVT